MEKELEGILAAKFQKIDEPGTSWMWPVCSFVQL
jgi:hypothetical protein